MTAPEHPSSPSDDPPATGLQGQLFDVPPEAREPLARVVLLTGPSGSGKTRLARRLGLPVVPMDDFYRDGDHPGLPRRHGMVDWDDPASWDGVAATAALVELVTTGATTIPVYDIPSNSRTGSRQIELGDARIVVAEGIFAIDIAEACRAEGILADAIYLSRPRLKTFAFRLARDLDEARKPAINLIRRGLALTLAEPAMHRELEAKGARRMTVDDAERTILRLAAGLPPEPAP